MAVPDDNVRLPILNPFGGQPTTGTSTTTTRPTEQQPPRIQFDRTKLGMKFLRHVNYSDPVNGEPYVETNSIITKKWLVKNTGSCAWDKKTKLCFTYGNILYNQAEIAVPESYPGEEVEVSVQLKAPSEKGQYQIDWRLRRGGYAFGDILSCTLLVESSPAQECTAQELEMEEAGYTESSRMDDEQDTVEVRREMETLTIAQESSGAQDYIYDMGIVLRPPTNQITDRLLPHMPQNTQM